jgi:hypothetical protein
MDPSMFSIAWQRRAPSRSPVLIKNGIEEVYPGTTAELVTRARAVTLITRDGAEVQVGVRRTLGPESWEGEVLRVAPTGAGIQVGATVAFEVSHVQSGTV